MNDEKKDAGTLASNVGKSALSFLGKAKKAVVSVIDQNGDGELNMQDVSIVAKNVADTAKRTASALKDGLDARAREIEKQQLKPFFMDDFNHADFRMPKLIRIAEIDEKHAKSVVCKDSIGYLSSFGDMVVLTLYPTTLEYLNISFFPSKAEDFYYMDPSDRNKYILLSDYFNYVRGARVRELTKIAQDLGAKHFRVTLHEQVADDVTVQNKTTIGLTSKIKGISLKSGTATPTDQSLKETSHSSSKVMAETNYPGHEPCTPVLQYLKNDQYIVSLVQRRMDPLSPVSKELFNLKLSNTSGIRLTEAQKIDLVLKALKITCARSIIVDANHEEHSYFEYEVDF